MSTTTMRIRESTNKTAVKNTNSVECLQCSRYSLSARSPPLPTPATHLITVDARAVKIRWCGALLCCTVLLTSEQLIVHALRGLDNESSQSSQQNTAASGPAKKPFCFLVVLNLRGANGLRRVSVRVSLYNNTWCVR